jgi:hypothetical protein
VIWFLFVREVRNDLDYTGSSRKWSCEMFHSIRR